MQNAKTAVVIGSGFGGLALAIRLQSAGIATTLVEKRDKFGGRAYVYEQDGFTFDAGPTVITDPTCLQELFALSGRKLENYVELMPVSPFYQLRWEDGATFDYVNDQAELERQMAAFCPADVDGYRRFRAYSERLLEEGYVKLGHVPFPDFRSMVRVAPQLVALQSYRSVYSKVSQYVSDEHLRQAFSFHSLLVGGNPFATSSIYALIHALERRWGVWFPRGGTGALINKGLVQLFKDLGGQVTLSTSVSRIETASGRVRAVIAADGRRFPADIVASNADVVHTYRDLLKDEPLARPTARSLMRKRFSMSLFVIYFGLRRQHPDLKHHIILFGRRYRELINEIFKGPALPDDFSLYLHAPSVTDPSLAPPGCSTYYVLSPVPHLAAAPVDWSVEGPRYRDRILDYLETRVLPGLRSDLVTCRIFTPQDFNTELNAHLGSAFSLEPILTQSAYFRAHNADDRIKGLYLVGAGTHPGAGIPGVVGSAKATARVILEDQHDVAEAQ
ncbi:phytoene desaturase [Bradyrhizobium sp. STM 3809]|uniref:phytoene desaturase n=1 Tax=Bradyrhizobium sp. STM 3809 TaxID=551936 RepID=UPI0002409909|nr:phytoene desaturase [Bradyrhizobium sp. STM 3809]CCE02279.1 Phytoene dehydrogenase (Phytoene desaturase) [Bradyrhizobium sp. STM 3809]